MLHSWLLTLGLHCGREGNVVVFLLLSVLLEVESISLCLLCVQALWPPFIRVFNSSPPLLSVTCLPCRFSWESIVVLEAAATALWTPPAPFWGTELLCLGHKGTWKSSRDVHKDLSQPVSSPSAQMQQRVSGWCLSTSFLHLPGKAERTNPALFSPGKSENYSLQLRVRQSESLWRDGSGLCRTWGRRGCWIALLQHQCPAMEQESLPWASEQVSSSRSTRGFGFGLSWGGHLSLYSWQRCSIPSFSSQRYQ